MLAKAFLISALAYFLYYLTTHVTDYWPSPIIVEQPRDNEIWKTRKDEVREVFHQSWVDYVKNGWGKDVYHPVSQTAENMGQNPLGWIIVDSLDTLHLMNMSEELKHAGDWIEHELNYDFDYEVNVFETTIRMLGGFLSAFHLTKDNLYLDKAVDLADRLIGGFESNTGIPYASVNLKTGKGVRSHVDMGSSSTAEVATLQLEFKYLSQLTGNSIYWRKVENIMAVLDSNHPTDGLVPIYIQPETGLYWGKLIRLGSRGDSYYEYLIKQYLQTNETVYKEMYDEAIQGVKKHLVRKSNPSRLTFIGELPNGINGEFSNKMDHLVCFLGGTLAVGATSGLTINEARQSDFWNPEREYQFSLGKELAYTCYKMYHDVSATGLAPEIVVFNTDKKVQRDFYIKPADTHNLQRPETVESLFYMFKITGDPMYREWGYEIFKNFVKHTSVTSGGRNNDVRYSCLQDVTATTPNYKDDLESFWFAETLKYLYLLFDDDVAEQWDLKKVVFNTEAHPFPRFDQNLKFKTGWERLKHTSPTSS
ncbi:BA75_02400T0 [Komagataella pastoris]|uniref:alpha-1,2-Mannosidase n=1 Tax=Komagataella pastoris TaxID=4922 RepID=A0A1B2JAQ0_PICPA|nr:BA75_02400T0 [Komagataella pastoris]